MLNKVSLNVFGTRMMLKFFTKAQNFTLSMLLKSLIMLAILKATMLAPMTLFNLMKPLVLCMLILPPETPSQPTWPPKTLNS